MEPVSTTMAHKPGEANELIVQLFQLTLGAFKCESIEPVLKRLLELSSAPMDQVLLLRKGTLSEFISDLEKETDFNEQQMLLSTILTKVLPAGASSSSVLALEILRNISRSKRMKEVLFETPRLVDTLKETMKKRDEPGSTARLAEKELAIQAVNNLGCNTDIAVKLCQECFELVDELMECAVNGETFIVREWAIRALNNMAFAEPNQKTLFTRPNLVDTFINLAGMGESDGIREWSVAALDNLAVQDAHKTLMVGKRGFLPALVSCATCEGSEIAQWALKEKGMKALNNLAALPQVSVWMFLELRRPGLHDQRAANMFELLMVSHDFAVNADSNEHILGFREAMMGLLLGLSCPSQNHLGLFNSPQVMTVLMNRVKNGSSVEQEHALGTMMNLAVTVELRMPMLERGRMVDDVVQAIETARTMRVREHGVGLLGNLALDSKLVQSLVRNRGVIFALVDGVLQYKPKSPVLSFELGGPDMEDVTQDEEEEEDPSRGSKILADWSRQSLWTLGFRNKDFPKYFEVLVALSSMYHLPRLGKASLFRKLLPKEMVREIAKLIVPINDQAWSE